MNTATLIWIGVIVVVFAFLAWKGYLRRFADYVAETREELRKCTWPTLEELKGSTVLVTVAVAMLGAFTFVVDRVFQTVVLMFFKA